MKVRVFKNTPEIQKARQLAHEACDLSFSLLKFPRDRHITKLRAKALNRANRRLDAWQRLMEGR